MFHKRLTKSGSVTVPVAVRRELNIQPGDGLELERFPDGICIRPQNPRCVFCNKNENDTGGGMKMLMGKYVCMECMKELGG